MTQNLNQPKDIIVNKTLSTVFKACLAVVAISFAASGFAEVIDCTQASCNDSKPIIASVSALSAGGYELSVGRAFDLGVLSPDLLGGYQANISLIGGSRQERSYAGLHVQSIPFRVVDGIYMRGGVGYAATSTGRLGLPDDLRGTPPGSPVSSIRPPLPVMMGDERRNSPFLSLELAHAVQPGVEAFVHAKYFSGFATRDGHEERTFGGVGLRTTF